MPSPLVSSPCDPFEYEARGREPIAVDQPQGGDRYPFVDPSDDVKQLIADFYLSYEDPAGTFQQPFHLAWIYGFGCLPATEVYPPTHGRDLIVRDADNQLVFDSREAVDYAEVAWGTRLLVIEWKLAESVCRIVQHLTWSEELEPRDFDLHSVPDNSVLDARTCERLPLRVNALQSALTTFSAGNLKWQNGYNTEILVEDAKATDGGRRITRVTMSAEAGSGTGTFGPGCDDDDILMRSINSTVATPAGDFKLDAAECYRIDRPSTILSPFPRQVSVDNHTLTLVNNCGPCCECQDFINVYEAIRKLRNIYASLRDRAVAVRDQYALNRTRWMESRDCRVDQALRLVVQPECPNEVAFAAGFCNTSDECLDGLELRFSFEFAGKEGCNDGAGNLLTADTTTDPGVLVCGSTFRGGNSENVGKAVGERRTSRSKTPYSLSGEYPVFSAHFDRINPGDLAYVTFRMYFEDGTSGDVVELVLQALQDDTELTNCPIKGSTGLLPGDADGECCGSFSSL